MPGLYPAQIRGTASTPAATRAGDFPKVRLLQQVWVYLDLGHIWSRLEEQCAALTCPQNRIRSQQNIEFWSCLPLSSLPIHPIHSMPSGELALAFIYQPKLSILLAYSSSSRLRDDLWHFCDTLGLAQSFVDYSLSFSMFFHFNAKAK